MHRSLCKLGCVVRMVVDYILPHAESGPNDHRKDASPFRNLSTFYSLSLLTQFSGTIPWLMTHIMTPRNDSFLNPFQSRWFHFFTIASAFESLSYYFTLVGWFKGSSDPSHFIIEINLGKRPILHRTTLKLNLKLTRNRLKMASFTFRVVLCRIRLFPKLISKMKWLNHPSVNQSYRKTAHLVE